MTAPILHLSIPVRDLTEARRFYETALGCTVGRVRPTWLDVWFFGMQITLHHRPEDVLPPDAHGVRHFGVVLADAAEFDRLTERLRRHRVPWLSEPAGHDAPELSGKTGGKIADPSGNVIEVKHYDDLSLLLGG